MHILGTLSFHSTKRNERIVADIAQKVLEWGPRTGRRGVGHPSPEGGIPLSELSARLLKTFYVFPA